MVSKFNRACLCLKPNVPFASVKFDLCIGPGQKQRPKNLMSFDGSIILPPS